VAPYREDSCIQERTGCRLSIHAASVGPSATPWRGRIYALQSCDEQQQWWPTVLDHDSTGPTVRRYNSQPWTEWTPWLLSVADDERGSERRMQSINRLEIRQFSLRKFWIWRNTYSRRRRMSTHCSYRLSVLHIPTESVSLFRASFLHKTLKQNCEGLYAAIAYYLRFSGPDNFVVRDYVFGLCSSRIWMKFTCC